MNKYMYNNNFVNLSMLIISVYVVMLMMSGKIEYVNMVQIEFMFMMLIIMSAHVSMNLFLMMIMLSGLSSVVFMLLFIKTF